MAEAGKAGNGSLEELISQALAHKEQLKKPQAEPIKPQSLLERIILSRWTPPIYAAAIGALNYLTPKLPPPDQTDNLITSGLIAGLGYLAAGLMRQDWLMRKAESVRRKTRPLPSKVLGIFSEHPEIIAGGVAAYLTAKFVSPLFVSMAPSDIFRHPGAVPIALQLSAYLAPTLFTMAYPAVSLSLGRIFHPETAKALYRAYTALSNATGGKYSEAVSSIAKLIETQRSYSSSVALQALAADFQALNNDSSFLDTFYGAITTQKTSYTARSDWALRVFIEGLKSLVVEKAKKLRQQVDPPALPIQLRYIIQGSEAFAVGNIKSTDSCFLSAVEQGRKEFLPHAFRAAFLRKTGRQASADLEMRICAEIIMEGNPELVEVTEESRNEVFFSGNIALKRNKDPEQLTGEFSLLKSLRGKFGQSIIYPLPVHKFGDFYYSPSERGPQTLLELMRQGKARYEDFAQAIALMPKIQRFGMELHERGELNFDDAILSVDISKPETLYFSNRRRRAIEQTERFNRVKLPESYKNTIIQGLAFVDAELASSKALTMYSDRGPKNWLKLAFGQIQALDFEPKSLKLLPPQMDLVNLIEFADYLTPQQRHRLIRLYIEEYEKECHIKLDRQEFIRKYEFAGLQWHYERLIYNPEEASKARTPERQEAKKKEQLYHLAKAGEHLDTIIARGYAEGESLAAAKLARRELEHPIFADKAEYDRLCRIVEREKQELLVREPLPASKTRLALASLGVTAILAASVFGAVMMKNNLIPIANVPVFPQGGKVLLSVSRAESSGSRVGVSTQKSIDYYVLDSTNDNLKFLASADTGLGAGLSAFQDKAVFMRDGRITLYDFVKKEFRAVSDDRFENPEISPNGLWIASNLRQKYLSQSTGEIWLIRPADMMTKQFADVPNAFSPTWSMDGSHLAFLSNSEPASGKSYADQFKVWINTENISSGEIHAGPLISERGRGVLAWSSQGSLAYIVERKGEKQTIQISDPQFKSAKEIYTEGNRDMLGYKAERINNILFAGPDHLLIQSTLSNDYGKGFTFMVSLLDLKSSEMITLANPGFIGAVSSDGSRVLYTRGNPADLYEFDIKTGHERNLTQTPAIKESAAVYSPDGRKAYVVAYPAALSAIDLSTGKSKLLRQEPDGSTRYSLTAP